MVWIGYVLVPYFLVETYKNCKVGKYEVGFFRCPYDFDV